MVDAWDRADPKYIHPAREHVSEAAYWESGEEQAEQFAAVLPAGSRVLDFGCGDGRVAIPLRKRGLDVVAVDASPNMIRRLAANDPTMPSFVSDGSDLVEKLGAPVDAVICIAVLIHHDYRSCEQVLSHLRDVVRPGGVLILHWPLADRPEERRRWIEVTTWSDARQQDVARRLGLQFIDLGLAQRTLRVPE